MGDKREPMLSLLFGEFFVNSEDQKDKKLFLSVADEAEILQNDSTAEVIAHINTCLNSGHRRKEGASLLCSVLRQSNTELFQEHAETWGKLLLQAIQSYDDFDVQQITCQAMAHLLRVSTSFPELSRSFSVNIIPHLLSQLLTFPDKWRNLTFNMLLACIKTYPGPCGNVRLKVEQLILRWFVESDLACKLYSYLPQCGGAGSASIKFTVAWSTSFNKLLTSLSDNLEQLYGFVETGVEKPGVTATPLVFPELPEMEPARTLQLQKQVIALCSMITHMLRPSFPAPVQLDINSIVQIICRIMAISPDFLLTRPTQDRIRLAGIIPSIHIAALKVLDALMKFAGSAMIPVASTVNQIYTQNLVWIQRMLPGAKYGTSSTYAGIHRALWESIITWTETLGANSGIEDIADDLIKAVVHVAMPVQDTVSSEQNNNKLSEVSDMFHGQRNKGKGKGKSRNRAIQDAGQLSSQRKLNYTADWKLVTALWNATSLLIREVGAFIPASCYQAVHNVLFVVLSPVQKSIPYVHPKCLSAAYSALLACVMCPHPKWPAPVQIATELFSRHKEDPIVRQVCMEGLRVCENIIHSRAPSYQVPLRHEDLVKLNPENNPQESVNKQPRNVYVLPVANSQSNNQTQKDNGKTDSGTNHAEQSLARNSNKDDEKMEVEFESDISNEDMNDSEEEGNEDTEDINKDTEDVHGQKDDDIRESEEDHETPSTSFAITSNNTVQKSYDQNQLQTKVAKRKSEANVQDNPSKIAKLECSGDAKNPSGTENDNAKIPDIESSKETNESTEATEVVNDLQLMLDSFVSDTEAD